MIAPADLAGGGGGGGVGVVTKIFLKAPLAPIYTNFEGGARAEKRDFLVKTFQKSA